MRVDLTEKAKDELEKFMESREENKPLRIYIAGYGWGGPSFGLALDERKEGDISAEVGGYTFLVEEDLTAAFSSFTIDYSDSWLRKGFSVLPNGRDSSSC